MTHDKKEYNWHLVPGFSIPKTPVVPMHATRWFLEKRMCCPKTEPGAESGKRDGEREREREIQRHFGCVAQ